MNNAIFAQTVSLWSSLFPRVLFIFRNISGDIETQRRLYEKVNVKIEKLTYYGRDVYLKILMSIFYLSPPVISYINYFALNKGEESFALVFPATYVFLYSVDIS